MIIWSHSSIRSFFRFLSCFIMNPISHSFLYFLSIESFYFHSYLYSSINELIHIFNRLRQLQWFPLRLILPVIIDFYQIDKLIVNLFTQGISEIRIERKAMAIALRRYTNVFNKIPLIISRGAWRNSDIPLTVVHQCRLEALISVCDFNVFPMLYVVTLTECHLMSSLTFDYTELQCSSYCNAPVQLLFEITSLYNTNYLLNKVKIS